jgi:P27 family predicted phage terminase small subunit
MPRAKKPKDRVVDKRNGRTVGLVGNRLAEPPMPAELSEETAALWRRFWSDPLAGALRDADLPVVLRWIDNLNRYLACCHAADGEPLTAGSAKQLVENPLRRTAAGALAAVQACEKQLGVGPHNRVRLGLEMVQERMTLEELNAKFVRDMASEPSEPDPRLSDPRSYR